MTIEADNTNTTNGTNGISVGMADSPCPCDPGVFPYYCPVHRIVKRKTWVKLCQSNPQYRRAWDEGRGPGQGYISPQKPPQPHWATCEHRGKSTATISGRTAGTGCAASRADVYWCNFFEEPVLKVSPARCRDKVREQVEGYTGRTCSECPVPSVSLPIPTGGLLLNGFSQGIITGANEKHWTCLGALAIAAHEQRLGFAVADHGLTDIQRAELDRVGVWWIEHGKPDNKHATHRPDIISDKNAWWKPWICMASPFEQSAWIDADTAVVGRLAPLFTQLPCVSTQWQFMDDAQRLYRHIVSEVFGNGTERLLDRQTPPFQAVNTGIIGFERGDLMLQEWGEETLRILASSVLLKKTTVRDQTAYLVMLMRRYMEGKSLPHFLGNEWNWPADGLHYKKMGDRKKIPRDPAQFLEVSKQRHPGVRIAHWLGKPKPWSLLE